MWHETERMKKLLIRRIGNIAKVKSPEGELSVQCVSVHVRIKMGSRVKFH